MKTAALFFVAIAAPMMLGQAPATGGAAPAGLTAPGSGSRPTGPTTTPNPVSNAPQNNGQNQTGMNQPSPIFFYGKVAMADGSPIPNSLSIVRVCFSSRRTVAYTDMKGGFSYQTGAGSLPMMMAGDSADTAMPGMGAPGMSSGMGGRSSPGGMPQMETATNSTTLGCELRVELPGFRAEPLSLDRVDTHSFGSQNLGTMVLHRLANVEGTSVSATLFNAPAPARKAYESGLQALEKNKLPEAQKNLEKALALDGKMANAWLALGRTQLKQNRADDAHSSFLKALEADSKLVEASVELGIMAGRDRKWREAAQYLDAALKLDPVDFPQIWFTDAVANFNTGNFETAEKAAREALKLDPAHKNPQVSQLLGMTLAQKHDYAAAAQELKTYMKFAPPDTDFTEVKQQLSRIEELAHGAQ